MRSQQQLYLLPFRHWFQAPTGKTRIIIIGVAIITIIIVMIINIAIIIFIIQLLCRIQYSCNSFFFFILWGSYRLSAWVTRTTWSPQRTKSWSPKVINIAIITITCVLMACIITIALIVMNMIITIVIIVTGMEPIGFIILSIMPAIANSGDQSFAESTCLNSETTFAESKKQSKWLEQGCPSRDATFEVVKSVEMKWVDGINGSCEENLELPSLLWMDSLYSLYIPYIFPIYSMYIPYIQKTRIPDWPTCCADD